MVFLEWLETEKRNPPEKFEAASPMENYVCWMKNI